MASTQATTRLEGLDLARYLAFVGMVIVNFKVVMGSMGDGDGPLWVLTGALEGRAAATFVVLAGIGLGLAAGKRLHQTRIVTLKRAAFLLAVGLLNVLVFDADILHYYAFYFLFGALLLPLSSRALVYVILALNLGFVVLAMALDFDAGWDWDTFSYPEFWTPVGFVRNLLFNGWHPVVPWLGFLLFGLILSRLNLSAPGVQWRLALGGVAAMLVAEVVSAVLTPWFASIDPELAHFARTHPVPPVPLYFLAGIGAASVVVGLCLRFAPALARFGVLGLVAPAGRQTLTLYIGHILIGMGVLEEMGLIGGQDIETAVVASLTFCALATVYAWIWSRFFVRGPVEWVMRKVAG
ncbi:MAG: DUF418 domain-containing protein [Paracoccaceae bacterium]